VVDILAEDVPGAIPEDDFTAGDALYDHADLDRLSLAAPLLGATGWIDGLAKLISIDTSPAANLRSDIYADALQDMFAPLGFSFRRIQVPDQGGQPAGNKAPAISMIAARRTGRRVCSIYFRTGTLAAGEGWTRAPFALTRQSNRLYGRGTTDMKGAIAAVWAALRAADAVGLGLGFDPVLLFCADREDGQHSALRHLAAQGLVEGHVICLDGPAAPRIWSGSPGSLRMSLTLSGVGSDQQDREQNPIDAMAPVMARLMRLKQEIEARQVSDLQPPARLSVTSMHAGEVGAVWPGHCRLLLNRTYRPDEEVGAALAEVEAAVREGCRSTPHLRPDLSLYGHCLPVRDPDHGPNWNRWKQALNWGFGYAPSSFRRWSGTDGSPMGFVQLAGVQEILLSGLRRPGCTNDGADEFTTVEDVEALARSVLAYLADTAEIPAY
jgi:succinyl-diaminopimelate desuccinylase